MEDIQIVEIKDYQPEDLASIHQLLKQLTTSPVEFTAADLKAMIDSPNSRIFLIRCQNETAGMLSIGSYLTPTGTKHWIEDVVVDDQFRGRSLGRKLIEHAIKELSTAGKSSLMLTSNPTRVAANQLYQSVGFEQKETNVYKMTFADDK